ncbi:uncharacterized protein LOC133889347 [Phragmites australis]|uniref:uncharacterized protein LOC133889347 n=1 Tax=Phragmites australis TaxID=29695 RepID=UPI002D78D54D|nr:uncharacterized protein LOC133889347 [Phragmites australis]
MINSRRCSIGAGTAAGALICGFTRCADCRRCLPGALAGRTGMQVLRLSCMARYESYPIYNATYLQRELGVDAIEHDGRGSNVIIGPNGNVFPPTPAPRASRARSHGRRRKRRIILLVPITTGVVVVAGILLSTWFRRKQAVATGHVVVGSVEAADHGASHRHAEQ